MGDSVTEALVAEFLAARGLNNLATELRASGEQLRHHQPDRVVAEMLELIDTLELSKLHRRWCVFRERLFNNIPKEQAALADEFEADTYKLYLVRCVTRADRARCSAFFVEMSSLVQNSPSWTEWLRLPFVSEPRECDAFKKYFTKQWREIFALSLHNFFHLVLSTRPAPLLTKLTSQIPSDYSSNSISAIQASTSSSDFEGTLDGSGGVDEMAASIGCLEDELLDDFAVIAQCTAGGGGRELRTSSSKQSLKTLIKSIGSKKSANPDERKGAH